MKIYAVGGLHPGVYQALSSKWFKFIIDTPGWSDDVKPRPDCIRLVSDAEVRDTQYDAVILSYSPLWHETLQKFPNATIVFFDMMNARGVQFQEFYSHPRVVLVYISDGCRLSHGVYEGPHKVIYPGIDPDIFKGYVGNKPVAVTVRNAFRRREPDRYALWESICGAHPKRCIGHEGETLLDQAGLVKMYQESRVYVNVELHGSTFSIAAMESMVTGMPIVSTDVECNGEVIRNGFEGYINNNNEYLRQAIDRLMVDQDLAHRMGAWARKSAMVKYSPEVFNTEWSELFENLPMYRRNG